MSNTEHITPSKEFVKYFKFGVPQKQFLILQEMGQISLFSHDKLNLHPCLEARGWLQEAWIVLSTG